jgi:23S rRNA (pseudouridine1915-N3)-methyltransferase
MPRALTTTGGLGYHPSNGAHVAPCQPMKPLRLYVVGAAKAPFFRDAAAHYLTAIRRYLPAEEIVVRDGKASDAARRKDEEGKALLAKLSPRDCVIVLDEHGKSLPSRELAAKVLALVEDPGRVPCFVVGGAFGLSQAVLDRADLTLALGPGTLPHELARVVLYEQLYRAAAILAGAPYHH